MPTGAQLLVKCLEANGVDTIYGIPGAKVDAVFDALIDSSIRLILCRHEQNAAFMAAAHGRLTGQPGVVLVTSGPGISNLATGLLTATSEGDPIVAIGGNVPMDMLHKDAHQMADNVGLMRAATKYSAEIVSVNSIPEVVAESFRVALAPRRGASFISLPQDISRAEPDVAPITYPQDFSINGASDALIEQAAGLIEQAQRPVLFLGEEASIPAHTKAIRALLEKHALPVVSTFQAAGVVSQELEHLFAGRVGLFANQPGDHLLHDADLVVTVGLNPAEYDPEVWNVGEQCALVHLSDSACDMRNHYQPTVQLVGSMALTLAELTQKLDARETPVNNSAVSAQHEALYAAIDAANSKSPERMHPLHFIKVLGDYREQAQFVCDIGSVYMWMARYCLSYEPHQLLFSNGQQTLGVALPWAMAARLANPSKPVISVSGDGGFLFSAMELETAVREQIDLVHCVWSDGHYNMVQEQQRMKYHRDTAVKLGHVNLVSFADAFGAKGFAVQSPDDFKGILDEALATPGPVLIDIPIDYSDNAHLFEALHDGKGN